ncbi:MAG: sugar ABC transporter permease YjfF [Lachnospiraceae bacterium]|nr:sugar ABC transporter permease YjfF [Lachnospiraceae bacterium]
MKNLITKMSTQAFVIMVTIILFIIMYAAGCVVYADKNFTNIQVFFNLFISNAGLIIISASMTMVMISGGIDISVGSQVALVCMMMCDLVMNKHVPTAAAIAICIVYGIVYGIYAGVMVAYLNIQPFIVGLSGMFFARGMTAVINTGMLSIADKTFDVLAKTKIMIPIDFLAKVNKRGMKIYPNLYPSVIIAFLVLVIMFVMLKYTKFGRAIYAIGGNEQSALLMGLNVKKTKFLVYLLDGAIVALGSVVYCMNTCGGFVAQAQGLEMDAIAAAVIGGTSLMGGVGNVFGTLLGVMTKATIEALVSFQGSLSSWWAKIIIATLLAFFIILQSIITRIKAKARD